MIELINNINKVFDNRIRLGIMAILLKENWIGFTTLRNKLHLTDGNLNNHISALLKHKMIKSKKQFVGNKPLTTYKVTHHGVRKFTEFLNAIEKLKNDSGI